VPVSLTLPSGSESSGALPLPEFGPKPLFDENLAPRLPVALADLYPNSVHVTGIGLKGTSDTAVWAYAAAGGFVLVTKDEDFHRLSVLRGFPPKVLWLRLGNCSTADVAHLLRSRLEQVVAFAMHEDAAFLALGMPGLH
jgi:predicted nuclease of predicted toxin-antitoxin system